MIKLIVHADDFGLSEEINKGIIEAHTNGIVTSTSIMACGSSFDHAVSKANSIPTLDMGVHLTLVEEKPLSDSHLISSIVDDNGTFYSHISIFFRKYLMGNIDDEHVYRELDLQMQKAMDSGLPISHLDSHQHVHILPGIYQQVIKLAEKYNIGAIRIPKETVRGYMFRPDRVRRTLEMVVLNRICQWIKKPAYPKPNYFLGFYDGGMLNKSNLIRTLSEIRKPGIYELMCHPGYTPAGNKYSHWKYQWEDELSALTDHHIRNLISDQGISLISYRYFSNENS